MFNFRKKKQPEQTTEQKQEVLLTEWITELKKLGYSNEQIKKKFMEKNYPSQFIEYLLELNKKEVKMATQEVEDDFEEETEEDYDQDDSEESEEIEEVETPKVVKEVEPIQKVEKPVERKITNEDIVSDLQAIAQVVEAIGQRLQTVEAKLFRLQNA
jgi:DNA-binding transcriptional MerR regulator